MDIICVPAIVSIVFSLMEVYKRIAGKTKHEETLLRLIPVASAIIGIIGGIVCFYAFPAIIAATDAVTAILIGGASGLSATGCNQLFKQLTKFNVTVKEPTKDEDTEA